MYQESADMFCWSSYPTLVLDVSGKVVSCNEGLRRLMKVGPTEEGTMAIRGCHISDLGILLLPTKNLISRDWESLLEIVSSNANNDGSTSDKHKPGHQVPKDLYEMSETFWNAEDERLHVRELNVTISYKKMKLRNRELEDERQSSLPIRAQVRFHTTQIKNTTHHILMFRRYFHKRTKDNVPLLDEPTSLDELSKLELPVTGEQASNPLVEDILENLDHKIHQMISKLIPSTLCVLDTDGQVQYLSPSWYDFTGSTRGESMRSEWARSVHPDDIEPMLKSWLDVIQTGKHEWTTEARYRRYDGCYFWFLVRAQSVKNDSGQIIRWYASMIDVNAIVLARLDSERRRESILKVLSQPDVSLWSLNQKHEMTLLEGTLSWDTSGFNMQGKQHAVSSNLEKAIDNILTGKTNLETIEHDGNGRWYRTRLVADLVHDTLARNASKQGVLALTIDISDVKARTKLQVENDRLSAIELAAREASKLKSQFLANVSDVPQNPSLDYSLIYARCLMRYVRL